MTEQTGLHLVLEAKASTCLSDRAACEAWVREAARLMDVTILSMTGYDLRLAHRQQPGVSVTAMLAESHLALDTWPEAGVVTLCVYSCKPFAEEEVVDSFARTFGVTKWLLNDVAPRYGLPRKERVN